jgi:hypothetical protein
MSPTPSAVYCTNSICNQYNYKSGGKSTAGSIDSHVFSREFIAPLSPKNCEGRDSKGGGAVKCDSTTLFYLMQMISSRESIVYKR